MPHSTRSLLRCKFGEHFISRLGPVRFNAFRLFYVSYVEDHVCTDKPASIDALKDNIEAFIREIPAEMLERAYQNWTMRMDHLNRSRDQHLHDIIFKN